MPDVLLYPRLPLRPARARLAKISNLAIPELTALAGVTHDDEVFPPTGGTRVQGRLLESLRSRIVELANAEGFPHEARHDAAARFDVAVGMELAELPMTAGEAARDDVWAFLTLVVLPDVACWRFPDRNERRLLGGVRNAFQRMWWRAFVLRDPDAQDEWHLLRLPEDALVGLMERPGISSNPYVAVEISRAIEYLARTVRPAAREDAWRDAYKRIRQRFPIVNFDWLPAGELRALLQAISLETIRKVEEEAVVDR